MNSLDFIYKRHSVRKFKNEDVPLEDIRKIITAATYAPSGKNLQNWHFVVVRNTEIINGISDTIEKKAHDLADGLEDEAMKNSFLKYLKYATVFKNAPVTILIFAGPYPGTGVEILEAKGAPQDEIDAVLYSNPGMQNIGAAIQTLMLAAADMGYGTCWMASQNFASKEIAEYIGFEKKGYYLAAITPLGVPEESELKSPPRKPVDEVMTIIE